MKIAIMQPYLLPYIGYFQLINAVDRFIFLDDVNYIKKGWINRNRILVNSREYLFTIPLKEASQNKLIKDLQLADDEKWKSKLIRTIDDSYKKAPQFKNVFPLVNQIIHFDEKNLSKYILNSIILLNEYLNISTEIVPGSSIYNNYSLKAQEKIVDICRKEHARIYINAIGGIDLYSKDIFSESGIELKFIRSLPLKYPQFNKQFIPWLSILDVMMFNSSETLFSLLKMNEIQ